MNKQSTNLQKYQSKNPLRKFLLARFMEKIGKMVTEIKPKRILDAGCGEGILIRYLDIKIQRYKDIKREYYGIDLSESAIKEAKKRVPFAHLQTGSVYTLPYTDNFFDLTICSEVLEHLEEPEKALLELKKVSKKYVLLSVPNEPWFRISSFLAGKYLKNWGNHPEHVQNWGKESFVKMVAKYFKVLKVETSFPWMIVLCEKN